jgi:hypothetical protein
VTHSLQRIADRVNAANILLDSPQFALEQAKTVGEVIYKDIGSEFARMTDDEARGLFVPANPHLIEVTNS